MGRRKRRRGTQKQKERQGKRRKDNQGEELLRNKYKENEELIEEMVRTSNLEGGRIRTSRKQ